VIQAVYAVPAAGAVTIMFSANLEVRDVVIVVAGVALVAVVLALLVYLCYRSGGLQGT
jgi:hypothetical protein